MYHQLVTCVLQSPALWIAKRHHRIDISKADVGSQIKALNQVQQHRCYSPVPCPTIMTPLQACGLQGCLTDRKILVQLENKPFPRYTAILTTQSSTRRMQAKLQSVHSNCLMRTGLSCALQYKDAHRPPTCQLHTS